MFVNAVVLDTHFFLPPAMPPKFSPITSMYMIEPASHRHFEQHTHLLCDMLADLAVEFTG